MQRNVTVVTNNNIINHNITTHRSQALENNIILHSTMGPVGLRRSSVTNDEDRDVPTWNRTHTYSDIMQEYTSTAGGKKKKKKKKTNVYDIGFSRQTDGSA